MGFFYLSQNVFDANGTVIAIIVITVSRITITIATSIIISAISTLCVFVFIYEY